MRIVGGEHRGARIYAPKGGDTRPTSDRVREAAFNLVGPVDDAAVLDLFAGSGAMGLEALSRGAARPHSAAVTRKSSPPPITRTSEIVMPTTAIEMPAALRIGSRLDAG